MMKSGPFPFLSHEAKGRDSTSFRGLIVGNNINSEYLGCWISNVQLTLQQNTFLHPVSPNSATSRCGKHTPNPWHAWRHDCENLVSRNLETWTPSEKKTYYDPLEIHYVDSGLCFLDINQYLFQISSSYYSQSLQIIYTLFSTIFKNFFI